jgi:PPM family protein phosphatase
MTAIPVAGRSEGRLSVSSAAVSQAGGREYNEDACCREEHPFLGCWLVADGLGGHRGGETASRATVDATREQCLTAAAFTEDLPETCLRRAEAAVVAIQAANAELRSMRTTAVILTTDYRVARWAHVGDSRLYHFRCNRVVAQTLDHSLPQVLVKAGELRADEIRLHEDRNRLLRVIGAGDLRPTVSSVVMLEPGDAFLLCSDGFWEYVLEAEMEMDVSSTNTPAEWLNAMELRLARRAPSNHDNYTAVAVRIGPAVSSHSATTEATR